MNIIRNLALASSVAIIASCANNDEDYDTTDPYGVPTSDGYQAVNPPAENPTYSAPAYETTAPPAYTTPPTPEIPAAPAAIASTHTIVKGDTLWGLSRKYGVSADAIRTANGMAAGDDNVRLGQAINIPAP